MVGGSNSMQFSMRDRAAILFLTLAPIAVWLTNINVLGNANGDVDTWFYFGHFMALGKYSAYGIAGSDYYETRLPFTLPGYAVFQLLPLEWAKAVFAYLVYSITLSAVYYTLRAHLPRRTVLLVLMLLACDIYFVRAANWNYVDTGVTVYQALTFASLTAASRSAHKRLWVGISAFCFTCSVFCHLGVVLSIIPIAIYAWLCLDIPKLSGKEFRGLFYTALAGVALCQIVFGLLNMWINDGDFFFVVLLYRIAKSETGSSQVGQYTPWRLLQDCGWLVIPFAIWIASGIALAAGRLKLVRLERAQAAMLLMAFATCTVLWLLDQVHFSYYLARSGMYVSLYTIVFYIGLGGLLMRGPPLSPVATLAIGVAFLLTLLVRLHYGGSDFPWLPVIWNLWIAGVMLASLLVFAFFAPSGSWKTAALCIAAMPTLFIGWRFENTRDAYVAFQAVREMAGDKMPYIWMNMDDPLYRNVLLPVTSSFTERAWWFRGEDFPQDAANVWTGDDVFVLSSKIRSLAEAQKLAAPHVTRIVPVRSRLLHLSQGDLWIGQFHAWNQMGALGKISIKLLREGKLPAGELYSLIGKEDGGALMAVPGKSGALMFGPYAALAPGRYKFTIVYGPVSGNQAWDICSQQHDGATTIVNGPLAPTNRTDARITKVLTFDKTVTGLELRAFYSGSGQLTLRYVGVTPLPDHSQSTH